MYLQELLLIGYRLKPSWKVRRWRRRWWWRSAQSQWRAGPSTQLSSTKHNIISHIHIKEEHNARQGNLTNYEIVRVIFSKRQWQLTDLTIQYNTFFWRCCHITALNNRQVSCHCAKDKFTPKWKFSNHLLTPRTFLELHSLGLVLKHSEITGKKYIKWLLNSLIWRYSSLGEPQDPKCIWKDVFETFTLNHEKLSFKRLQ